MEFGDLSLVPGPGEVCMDGDFELYKQSVIVAFVFFFFFKEKEKSDNSNNTMTDIESNRPFLLNETVQSLSWSDITVSVKDRDLIHDINGNVQQGMSS